MIVYLLLHLPTELGYVGSTETTAEKRFEAHWSARKEKPSPLHELMAASRRAEWERVTLEEYDDLESMLRGEVDWMMRLETLRPRVGLNKQVITEREIQNRLKAGAHQPIGSKRREDMSSAELAFFRAKGLEGAARHDAATTREERSANGKKGAAATKRHFEQLPADELAALRARNKAKWQLWWSGLTPEQQEEQREKGRVGGLKGGSKAAL